MLLVEPTLKPEEPFERLRRPLERLRSQESTLTETETREPRDANVLKNLNPQEMLLREMLPREMLPSEEL